jgi:hypothetical protein
VSELDEIDKIFLRASSLLKKRWNFEICHTMIFIFLCAMKSILYSFNDTFRKDLDHVYCFIWFLLLKITNVALSWARFCVWPSWTSNYITPSVPIYRSFWFF